MHKVQQKYIGKRVTAKNCIFHIGNISSVTTSRDTIKQIDKGGGRELKKELYFPLLLPAS